jgi:hypothetical protein
MNTKRLRTAFAVLLSVLILPTLTSAQSPGDQRDAGVQSQANKSPNPAAAPDATAATTQPNMTPASGHAGFMSMRWASPNSASATNPLNMTYHGGPVLAHPTIYAVWWGKPSDFPRDALDGLDDFLQGLDGSAYLHLADQYLFGKHAHTRFGGNLHDYSAPPSLPNSYDDIGAPVCKVLSDYGMIPDPTAIYAVYTSNFPNQPYYCAFHFDYFCPDGGHIHVAYLPNITANAQGIAGCAVAPPDLRCNSLSVGTQSAANFTAHEVMETITDPNIGVERRRVVVRLNRE